MSDSVLHAYCNPARVTPPGHAVIAAGTICAVLETHGSLKFIGLTYSPNCMMSRLNIAQQWWELIYLR